MAKAVSKGWACPPSRKRFMTAMILGIAFGFLCAYIASFSIAGIWWTPLMWTIVTDRMLIGMMVAFAGAFTIHPVFRFRIPAGLRGCCLGAFVSVPLATGAMIAPVAGTPVWTVFWMTIVVGAIYGVIIDLVATKVGGEGEILLK